MPDNVLASIGTALRDAPTIRFTLEAATVSEATVRCEPGGGRKYRRTKGLKGPRPYRTRPDPFAAVWEEIAQELTAYPERTAKAAFEHLQERYPGAFPATQLRTRQRRVQEWRIRTILAFDDRWLGEEVLVKQSSPLPLRAIVERSVSERSGKIGNEATAAAG